MGESATGGNTDYLGAEAEQLRQELLNYPYPVFYGSSPSVKNYIALEKLERDVGRKTLGKHHTEAYLWYQGLDLLHKPILGVWDVPDESIDGGLSKTAFVVQMQLVGLEVSSAKAALDQLVRGNYSIAFAAIRHLMEAYIQILYLGLEPNEAHLWIDGGVRTPGMSHMKSTVLRRLVDEGSPKGLARLVEAVYDAWSLMSKGSHPTGGGLTQVQPQSEDDIHSVGAVYRSKLAYVGFDQGLFGLRLMLNMLGKLRNPGEKWDAAVEQWNNRVGEWRDTLLDVEEIQDQMSPDLKSRIEAANAQSDS
jgi:hypothetical protein